MATTPNPVAGAQPQGGAPAGQGGGLEPQKMLAAITRLAQMAAQALPAISPEMETITKTATDAVRKLIGGQSPQPPQAPPA